MNDVRPAVILARGLASSLAIALITGTAAGATIDGSVLEPAVPRVIALAPHAPGATAIRLDGGFADWHGRLSHIAGAAHYDRGEWIYEDYPFSAYGAALPGTVALLGALGLLGKGLPPTQRLPGGLAEVQAPAGAGPFVDEADLSQLRVALRGSDLYVLARTTTMHAPVRTALLLLFNAGRGGSSRAVPFGSGLHTSRADTAALVTAAGTRVVNLVTGHVTDALAAAAAKGYVNTLETRLPLALVESSGGSRVQMVAATGLVDPGSFQLLAGGGAGPLAKVAPRFGEPVQAVYDRTQAVALAAHNIDGFFTAISPARLRRGDRERLLPGIGYTVRTLTARSSISHESGTDGVLRDYGLYVPRGSPGGRRPPRCCFGVRG